jgi:hypothetical protein
LVVRWGLAVVAVVAVKELVLALIAATLAPCFLAHRPARLDFRLAIPVLLRLRLSEIAIAIGIVAVVTGMVRQRL